MMLNMLKVQTTDRITAGTSAGRREGRVMETNCCQRRAPSTWAASYRSAGMDWRAPSDTTIMKGKLSQPLVARAVRKDVKGWSNQESGWNPRSCTIWFTTPNCRWNIPFQMRAVMYFGIAQGRISRTREFG